MRHNPAFVYKNECQFFWYHKPLKKSLTIPAKRLPEMISASASLRHNSRLTNSNNYKQEMSMEKMNKTADVRMT